MCTPKEAGSCIAAEVLGIPAVMIAAPGFVRQAKSTANDVGVGVLRVAEYPGAFTAHTKDELLMNTRNVLWPQIKKALTEPLRDDERFVDDGGIGGDGLPVVTPTEERVSEFLKFTDQKSDQSLGAIPPKQREVTVRNVAECGAMAGCPPEFMPILIAVVEAMKNGDFRRTLSSTHAWTPYCWLNGPVARQLGFDCAQGEISEAKNMQLGRFINLAMANFGGYQVKENRMGTFGCLTPWTLVENEKSALDIGWKPYHMQQGFGIDDSTITCASAINWGNNLVPATSDPRRIKDLIAWDAVEKQQMAVGSGMPCVYRTFLITPEVAKDLAKEYRTKTDFEAALVETARCPLSMRAFANYYGNPGSAIDPRKCPLAKHEGRLSREEHAEETPTPPWLEWTGIKTMKTVPVMKIGKSAFLVTGDPARNKEMCVPGGAPVTVKIRLPKDWNELMLERGYKPLEDFKLKTGVKPDLEATKEGHDEHQNDNGHFRRNYRARGERRRKE